MPRRGQPTYIGNNNQKKIPREISVLGIKQHILGPGGKEW